MRKPASRKIIPVLKSWKLFKAESISLASICSRLQKIKWVNLCDVNPIDSLWPRIRLGRRQEIERSRIDSLEKSDSLHICKPFQVIQLSIFYFTSIHIFKTFSIWNCLHHKLYTPERNTKSPGNVWVPAGGSNILSAARWGACCQFIVSASIAYCLLSRNKASVCELKLASSKWTSDHSFECVWRTQKNRQNFLSKMRRQTKPLKLLMQLMYCVENNHSITISNLTESLFSTGHKVNFSWFQH